MSAIVAFGHQPCGFVPKRFLYSKILTARRIAAETGGEVVFFYHDSDHDYRETITVVHDRQNGQEFRVNFEQDNKLQKKYSPMYAKRVPDWWREKMLRLLPRFAGESYIRIFESVQENNVADFCLEIYRALGLLDGIRIVRSSDPLVRAAACDTGEPFFVDLPHEGEIVRARYEHGKLRLHKGGDAYIDLPYQDFRKEQITPQASHRLEWMQSVIGCTHYIMGSGEDGYLDRSKAPEISFLMRDEIKDLHGPILDPVENFRPF